MSCQLGDVLVNSPPEIVFSESSGEGIVMINDWDYVFVDDYLLNRFSCDAGAPQQTYYADFYSLSKSFIDNYCIMYNAYCMMTNSLKTNGQFFYHVNSASL